MNKQNRFPLKFWFRTTFKFLACFVFVSLAISAYSQSDTYRRYIVTEELSSDALVPVIGLANTYSGAMNKIRQNILFWWSPSNNNECTAEILIPDNYQGGTELDLNASFDGIPIGVYGLEIIGDNSSSQITNSGGDFKILKILGEDDVSESSPVLEADVNTFFLKKPDLIVFENVNVRMDGDENGNNSLESDYKFQSCFVEWNCALSHIKSLTVLDCDRIDFGTLEQTVSIVFNFNVHEGWSFVWKNNNVYANENSHLFNFNYQNITNALGPEIVFEDNVFISHTLASVILNGEIDNPPIFRNNVFKIENQEDGGGTSLSLHNFRENYFLDHNEIDLSEYDTNNSIYPKQIYLRSSNYETENAADVFFNANSLDISFSEEMNKAYTFGVVRVGEREFDKGVWIEDQILYGPILIKNADGPNEGINPKVFVQNNKIMSIVGNDGDTYIPPIHRPLDNNFSPKIASSTQNYGEVWTINNLSTANAPFVMEMYKSNSRGDLLERIQEVNIPYYTSAEIPIDLSGCDGMDWISLTLTSFGYDGSGELTNNSYGTSEAIAIPLNIPISHPDQICQGEDLSISIPEIPMNNGGILYPIVWEQTSGPDVSSLLPADLNTPGFTIPEASLVPGEYTFRLSVETPEPSTYVYYDSFTVTVNSDDNCLSQSICIGSFSPEQNKEYLLQAWVSEDHAEYISSFDNIGVQVECYASGALVFSEVFNASGNIIDDWQKISETFLVPESTTQISVALVNASDDVIGYVDDVRIQPVNSSSVSYVYDSKTGRLLAQLDDNNYATFYEYSDEGKLERIKKETERGVVTIKESRNNTSQKEF